MNKAIKALIIAIAILTSSSTNESTTGYIFLGDSRTVGMNTAVDIEGDGYFVVAEVGKGYKWASSTGVKEIASIVENNTEYTDWVLISNLGVNDLGNANSYIEFYEELSENMEVYIVSVNPCKGNYRYLNSDIADFNTKVGSLDYITYVDTYTTLQEQGFNSTDGLHYGKSTYEDIYSMILSAVMEE